jgi:long-chain fatty acid transport protein
MRTASRRTTLAFATFAIGIGWPHAAHASGFAAARFGGELGNVTSTNPTALYYNPAGIGFSSGTGLYLDGTLALRHVTWEHAQAATDRPDPPGAEGANFGTAQLLNVFGGPMAGATTKLGNLALGGAFYVPFGGRAHWSKNDKFTNDPTFPLAADGVQRWHSYEGALTFIYFTAGAAYRLGPVSIGVTGNLVHSSVKNSQAKTPTGTGIPDTAGEGRDILDVSGIQGSFGLGAMVEAIPDRLFLAASYQAQPGLGPMRLKGTLTITYQGSGGPVPVTFDQALPDILRLGARYRASDTLELRFFGDLTRWSVLKTQCVAVEGHPCVVNAAGADAGDGGTVQNIRRRWRDTYGVHAGMSYWLKPELELFGGLAFETAATIDETLQPDLPDANNVAASVGARFELAHGFYLGGSYTHIQYANRDNTGKSQLANAEYPTAWPDGGGKYTQWIGVFDLNLEKRF